MSGREHTTDVELKKKKSVEISKREEPFQGRRNVAITNESTEGSNLIVLPSSL